MNDTTRTRTYRITADYRMDGVIVTTRTHTVILTSTPDVAGSPILASVDGVRDEMLAAHLFTVAGYDGRIELLDTTLGIVAPDLTPAPFEAEPIGTVSAHALHIALGRLGYGRGFDFASDTLGRPVEHLRALSAEEAALIWGRACNECGLGVSHWADAPTQGRGVAA